MEKLRHEISRLVNNVPIPEQKLDNTVQQSFLKTSKREKRLLFNKHNIIAAIASVFVLTFGVLLLSSYQPTATENNTNTDTFIDEQDNGALRGMESEAILVNLGMESEDKGVKVKLVEGSLDNQQMGISLLIDYGKEPILLPAETTISYELFIDSVSLGSNSLSDIDTESVLEKEEILISFPVKDLNVHTDIQLKITSINNLQGEWNFNFHINR